MTHPVLPYMPTVFIPVSNLKRSIEWYADLLEQSIVPKQDGGGIYYFGFGGTDIILDSNMWGFTPTIMFDSPDIDASRSFCETLPHHFMSDLFRYPDVSFFNIEANMLCQAHHRGGAASPEPVHPLLQHISRVIVHADDMAERISWYERFVDRMTEADPWIDGLPCIRMQHGAHLLFDDNRLCQSPRVFYDRLQLDFRVNPMFIIESPDADAALDYVRSKGATAEEGIQERLGVRFFVFHDPDGNGMMVCEKK